MTEFTDLDLYYMNAGEHTTLYEKMGAHIIKEGNKIIGTQFRVYAPNAREVFLVGNFNEWQRSHSMEREIDGVFQLYVD
ncbi:TPA: 1,4-alpha-glucan branching protein GlgB, partial [Streptococcus suis]|nr:1,4-alpha-glucan branching protein GlgB [Streptococcus suis]